LVLNGLGDAREIEAIRSAIERDQGVQAIYGSADMSKGEAVRGMVAATIEKFGPVDILVNNAGIQFTAPEDEFPPAKWDAILQINLSAAFNRIGYSNPQMKRQGWGRIVNIAPTHGLVASTHKATYLATKHGLVGLTRGSVSRRPVAASPATRFVLVGTNASRRKADQRHRYSKKYQSEGSTQGTPRGEAAVSRVCLSGAAWRRHCDFPLFASGGPDHGHGDFCRWWLDSAVGDVDHRWRAHQLVECCRRQLAVMVVSTT
jgi:short chain dehydrogenase